MCSRSSFYPAGAAGLALVGFLSAPSAFAQGAAGVEPSPAEQALINRQIAAIRSPQDRAAVQNQSLVWKMTTFLCQKAARAPLKRLGAGDRFFLQDDQPDSQVLVSPSLLEGRGQFRQADGISWTSFRWSCHLNPRTGAVQRFEATPFTRTEDAAAPSPPAGQVPACLPAQMDVTLDSRNGAFDGMSQSGTALVVKNTGPAACIMPPVPLVQFEDAAGKKLPAFRRESVPSRRPGPHGASARQHVVPVRMEARAIREATLHWVSGEVFDDSHNCVRPAQLVLKVGQREKKVPFKGQICAAAGSPQSFDQSPLQAHTDAQ
ncbi:DUF4232 domain-containing protein [Acetobacter persici]|uniref:DUF4232 domain-containing protein n=1 Tax=Acetobacter persici TaxID=1076596 RepID=UPI0039EAEB64